MIVKKNFQNSDQRLKPLFDYHDAIIAHSFVIVKKNFHSFFNFYIIVRKIIFCLFLLRLTLLSQWIQHFFKYIFLAVFWFLDYILLFLF